MLSCDLGKLLLRPAFPVSVSLVLDKERVESNGRGDTQLFSLEPDGPCPNCDGLFRRSTPPTWRPQVPTGRPSSSSGHLVIMH